MMMRFIVAIFYAAKVVLSLEYIKDATLDLLGAPNKTSTTHLPNAHFILFTNGKCEDCITYEQDLDNVVDSVSAALKASPSSEVASKSLVVGKVNIHKHTELADSLDVRGVPTLMLINDLEEIVEYSGAIKSGPLTKWLSKYLDNIISTKLTSKEDMERFVADQDVCLVAELPEEDLEPFSQSIRGLRQLVTYAWLPIQAKDGQRRLVLSKKGLPSPAVFIIEGDLKIREVQDTVADWIQENQIPFLGEIDLSNLDAYLHQIQAMIWYVGDKKGRDNLSSVVNPIYQNSKKDFNREFWWVWLDPNSSNTHSDFVDHYLRPKTIPSILITDLDGAGRFQLNVKDVDITTELVRDWMRRVLDGTESRELMSAAVPKSPINADGTEKLVTSTLKQWLSQLNNKALLLIIESVWCTNCASILTYLRDSEKFKAHAECLSIGRIEGSSNELDPHWNLSMVPGIILMKRQPFSGKVQDLDKKMFEEPFKNVDSFWKWVEDITDCKSYSQPKNVEL